MSSHSNRLNSKAVDRAERRVYFSPAGVPHESWWRGGVMWHVFTHELSIDGNWVADVDGRVEILWSEDFNDFGLGTIEFRHLRHVSEPGIGVREWFAAPSLDDPIAKIIVPDIRRLFRMIYGDEVLARAAEARAELAATEADRRNDDMT